MIKNHSLWALALGLGLGLSIGAAFASGVDVSPENISRFLGSLVGSIIAVSGDVSLYYLKEYDDRRRRRAHFKGLLAGAKAFAKLAEDSLQDPGNSHSAFLTFRQQFQRCLRYAQKYEYEDMSISQAHLALSLSNLNEAKFEDDKINDQNIDDLAKEYVASRKKLIHMAEKHVGLLERMKLSA